MNLELLQTNLSNLIKSRRSVGGPTDDYLNQVESSANLLLIRKIALWWRKIQVEQYCVLTGNLLKLTGEFDLALSAFISDKAFSSFREEVGNQFLEYIVACYPNSLLHAVARFESAIIKLKLGEEIETAIHWQFEPYSVISGLLRNELTDETLDPGNYEVIVSHHNKDVVYGVEEIEET